MSGGKKKARRSRLPQVVPRAILSAAITATPAALAGCGDDDGGADAGDSGFSVFAPPDGSFSVADAGFSVVAPLDSGFSVADAGFSVAEPPDGGFSVFAPPDASSS